MVVVSTRIKFCGITRLDDAELAVSAGAWAIGLIFWPRSPRRCELDAAGEITGAVKRRAEVAGVFVNATLDHVAATPDAVGLTMLQLHGDEGPAYCSEAARRTGCKVIKAIREQRRDRARWLRSTPTTTCSTATSPACRAARARHSAGTSCAGTGSPPALASR